MALALLIAGYALVVVPPVYFALRNAMRRADLDRAETADAVDPLYGGPSPFQPWPEDDDA